MSKIPNFNRRATGAQNENFKRPADAQLPVPGKRPKIEIAHASSTFQTPVSGPVSSSKTISRAPSSSNLRLRNPGFSEKAKQRALKPIEDNKLSRGSMPAITSQKPSSSTRRPAWDLKGRIQDMEENFKTAQSQNSKLFEQLNINNQRIAALEADNSLLNKDIQLKTTESEEASGQINELRKKLNEKTEENENYVKENASLRRKLQILNEDHENLKQNYEQQNSALRRTISNLTASKSELQADHDALENLTKNYQEKIAQLERTISNKDEIIDKYQTEKANLEFKLREEEIQRRKLHNIIQELKGNIRVFCRMRPLLPEEIKKGIIQASISTQDGKTLEILPTTDNKSDKRIEFSFDNVFPPSATQEEIFEEISQLVQSSIDGYNVCIFAYGQTGSGKTFTMEGPGNVADLLSLENKLQYGMIPRSVEKIFHCIAELKPKGWEYKVEALFLEIYNEKIQNILNSDPQNNRCEIIKSGKDKNDCLLSNVTPSPVASSQEIYNLLKKARSNRAVAATNCNLHSSRSHYVFQLKIFGENSITLEKCEGILNLVDLAGSERIKESGSAGVRLTEAKCINKSLSTLGKVIMSLSNKDPHIPYRDSKLTQLLSNSLGGNSKTLMFVNISPDKENISETINSLRFATMVNQCNIGTAQKRVK